MRTCACGKAHDTTYYAGTPDLPDECTECWLKRTTKTTRETHVATKKRTQLSGEVMEAAALAKELETERTSVAQALVELSDFSIETRDDLEIAGKLLEDVTQRRDVLETKLKAITGPLRTAEKEARELFRPALSALDEAEEWLRKRIAEARDNIETRNQALLATTQAVVEAGGDASSLGSLQSTAAPDGMGYREHWDFEIVDPSLLPREYLQPNEKAIREVVKALKGGAAIPGVRVFVENRVTVRKRGSREAAE